MKQKLQNFYSNMDSFFAEQGLPFSKTRTVKTKTAILTNKDTLLSNKYGPFYQARTIHFTNDYPFYKTKTVCFTNKDCHFYQRKILLFCTGSLKANISMLENCFLNQLVGWHLVCCLLKSIIPVAYSQVRNKCKVLTFYCELIFLATGISFLN